MTPLRARVLLLWYRALLWLAYTDAAFALWRVRRSQRVSLRR